MVWSSLDFSKARNNRHLVLKLLLYKPYLETYFLLFMMVCNGAWKRTHHSCTDPQKESTSFTISRTLEQTYGKPFQKSKLYVTNQTYFSFNTV